MQERNELTASCSVLETEVDTDVHHLLSSSVFHFEEAICIALRRHNYRSQYRYMWQRIHELAL